MPFSVGPMELIVLLVIVMMIFGAGRLPQVGNALGRSIREFRQLRGDAEDLAMPAGAHSAAKLDSQRPEQAGTAGPPPATPRRSKENPPVRPT
ncbi:MAG: twin-arginine translocase TatA/TatE family subunit [Chloroflexi bacterium]|nr:twin-arginine translocase TatA/TatE family subunit [Chloroflexota bacterium]